MTAETANIQTITCAWCGQPYSFERRRGNSPKIHPECRSAYGRDYGRRYMRERYKRDPQAEMRQRAEWRRANPQRARAIARRAYSVRCTLCGKSTFPAHVLRTKAARFQAEADGYICRDCWNKHDLSYVGVRCHWCNKPFLLFPSRVHAKSYCSPECSGALTRAGKRYGLSRERVRQIVNRELAEAEGITRAEALRRAIAKGYL